ncbi:MAG TPA: addiction module antidote protein, HigA family [Oceanospirillaceae bacterium]|nr:addiction module antidote protein, HigA family [Oceanospirillaceae bacterium]
MLTNNMRPIHPGEILREEYLIPLEMSANALAIKLQIPATRISAIVNEKRAITVDTALRLARFFGGDAQSWLNLQQAFDIKTIPAELEQELNYIVPMPVSASAVTA